MRKANSELVKDGLSTDCMLIRILSKELLIERKPIVISQAYHPPFVLRTCASCISMAASVVYKGFCEYDNYGFLNG